MDRTFLLQKRAITTFLSRKRAITTFLLRKRAIMTFLSRKFVITRSSIAFEDFLGSSIAPQVMPPWSTYEKRFWQHKQVFGEDKILPMLFCEPEPSTMAIFYSLGPRELYGILEMTVLSYFRDSFLPQFKSPRQCSSDNLFWSILGKH